MKSYVIAISGASGAVYGVTLLDFLLRAKHKVYLTLTHEARLIIKGEMGLDWGANFQETSNILDKRYGDYDLVCCDERDMTAPIASGSVPTEGMVVAPCSMKALAAIAHGISSTLVERAADVTLKEKRPLILIPRETPLSRIHLKNMLILADMGATLMPAMPAFYHRPKSIDDMVQFVVGRVLDALKIENQMITRWSGQ
ncbi:MAG: flavin prenyltransferase UbiX [Nitrospira sp.]|nr:UbiX family flavin prenyltransferase [Candidatus Manganitrophaceae bacterium]HIL34198.1 UbiX family flavin prenyltransferase [Candidatus Manganitrophaceae bacterium]